MFAARKHLQIGISLSKKEKKEGRKEQAEREAGLPITHD